MSYDMTQELGLPASNPEGDVQHELSARTVIDEQGFERRVYQLNPNLSISFRGIDELPTIGSNELDNAVPCLVTPDEDSRQVATQEFQDYVSRYPSTEAPKQHLIANASPQGVLDLTLCFSGNANAASLNQLKANFKAGRIGESETAFLDMMSAAVFQPDADSPVARTDGLMDVVLALSGNTQKQAELAEKAKVLEQNEEHLVIKELGDDSLQLMFAHEPVPSELIAQAKGLVLVRTLNSEPQFDDQGDVVMSPAAEYTKHLKGSVNNAAYIPRQTTHFTLNHKVVSHIGGDFRGRSYTVLAPLGAVLEANGRPGVLFGVDTFFTTGPGEHVTLPDAEILMPVTSQAELIVDDGHMRKIKSAGFSLEDISALKSVGEASGTLGNLEMTDSKLAHYLFEGGSRNGLITQDGMYHSSKDGELYDKPAVIAATVINGTSEQIAQAVAQLDEHALDTLLGSTLEQMAIDSFIIKEGGPLVAGGQNYDVTLDAPDGQARLLAEALHVRSYGHEATIERRIEEAALVKLHGKFVYPDNSGRYAWEEVNDTTGERLNEYLSSSDCPQRLRRAALEAGLLTVRGESDKYQQLQRQLSTSRPQV